VGAGDEPITSVGDAWGEALRDHLDGRDVAELLLELDNGEKVPAMQPEWFFRPFEEWDWWDREFLSLVEVGPVLDLGSGAGRAARYFQDRGVAVTAIDNSAGAVEVCRRRGVRDVRVGDVNDPPTDQRWGAVLLLCGNLGLGGSWEGNRRLLRTLSERSLPDALLVGDSVTNTGRNEFRLRIRYHNLVTPWWKQCNVRADEVPALVAGTGWTIERHVEDGADHSVLLRNQGAADEP
jgi:SAM-dependent methyltransferase